MPPLTTTGALAGLKKAVRAPGPKKQDTPEDDENEVDRKKARLAAIREVRTAKSDEEALTAFDALMESA